MFSVSDGPAPACRLYNLLKHCGALKEAKSMFKVVQKTSACSTTFNAAESCLIDALAAAEHPLAQSASLLCLAGAGAAHACSCAGETRFLGRPASAQMPVHRHGT